MFNHSLHPHLHSVVPVSSQNVSSAARSHWLRQSVPPGPEPPPGVGPESPPGRGPEPLPGRGPESPPGVGPESLPVHLNGLRSSVTLQWRPEGHEFSSHRVTLALPSEASCVRLCKTKSSVCRCEFDRTNQRPPREKSRGYIQGLTVAETGS